MTRPYSTDLRKRVVRAHLAGEPIRSVAARFGVSVSSVTKWTARYRATGSVAPGKIGGHRPWLLAAHRDLVLELIRNTPRLTIDRLRELLAAEGVAVCRDTIWRFLKHEGLRFKKTLFALEQARRAVGRKRARWRALKRRLDPDRLVFVDETWIKTNMAPLRGWAEKGRRLTGFAPHGHWRTMTFLAGTFLAGLRTDGLWAPYVFDGPINGRCFRAWVEQLLVPTLRPGDLVILDNLGSHKGKAVRQAIRNADAHLWFLPAYSPDLNPIEQAFAKIKHWMRDAQKRSVEDTWQHLGRLIDTIEPQECQNYIRNAGYGSA